MNRHAGLTDLFLFMIVAFVIVLISGIFIYLSGEVDTQLTDSLEGLETGATANYTEIVQESMGQVSSTFKLLYWLSVFIIVAMVIAIFIGSYWVTTEPVVFVPYIFLVIIAIIISVGISNAYQTLSETEILASTYAGFIGSNYILYYLPIWVTIIGFTGGIIMFVVKKTVPMGIYS